MTVRVHIERLIIDPALAGVAAALESAVAAALAQRLGSAPPPAWWGRPASVARLGATLPDGRASPGERIGAAVADSLAAGPPRRTPPR